MNVNNHKSYGISVPRYGLILIFISLQIVFFIFKEGNKALDYR